MLWGEALIEALVDMSDDAVLGNDQHGSVATWNRSAERLFGFRAAEVVGTPVHARDGRPHHAPGGRARMLEMLDAHVERIVIIGCQPLTFDGMGLSAPVAEAVDLAVDLLEDVLTDVCETAVSEVGT